MCSGCGRCGKVETSHSSVVTSVAPSVGLVQVASVGSRLQTNIIPAPVRVPDREPSGSVSSRMI